jgi:hypothetical protein
MKPAGALYYLSQEEYPCLGNTSTIRISQHNTVSGEIHFFAADKDALVTELRNLAAALENAPTP